MPFKKQFFQDDFKNALTYEWQKTAEIAEKVGCTRPFAKKELEKLFDVVLVGKLGKYCVYNAVDIVESRWVKGGKQGTREWRLKKE